jgi:hypothetical protein
MTLLDLFGIEQTKQLGLNRKLSKTVRLVNATGNGMLGPDRRKVENSELRAYSEREIELADSILKGKPKPKGIDKKKSLPPQSDTRKK